jgi:hypothetical protein
MSALRAYAPTPAPIAHAVGASMASAGICFVLPRPQAPLPRPH